MKSVENKLWECQNPDKVYDWKKEELEGMTLRQVVEGMRDGTLEDMWGKPNLNLYIETEASARNLQDDLDWYLDDFYYDKENPNDPSDPYDNPNHHTDEDYFENIVNERLDELVDIRFCYNGYAKSVEVLADYQNESGEYDTVEVVSVQVWAACGDEEGIMDMLSYFFENNLVTDIS